MTVIATICPYCFMETHHVKLGILLICQRCRHTHSEDEPVKEECDG